MSNFQRLALIGLLSATASTALAADLTPPAPVPPPGWQVTIGVGPEVAPAFPGARAVTILPTGILDVRRPGDPIPFSSPDDGFGIPLLDYGWIKAGPVGRVLGQRGLSNGNGSFWGLPNVGWSVELGIFGELWLAEHFRIRGEVRQAVSGHDGLDANIELDGVQRWAPSPSRSARAFSSATRNICGPISR